MSDDERDYEEVEADNIRILTTLVGETISAIRHETTSDNATIVIETTSGKTIRVRSQDSEEYSSWLIVAADPE